MAVSLVSGFPVTAGASDLDGVGSPVTLTLPAIPAGTLLVVKWARAGYSLALDLATAAWVGGTPTGAEAPVLVATGRLTGSFADLQVERVWKIWCGSAITAGAQITLTWTTFENHSAHVAIVNGWAGSQSTVGIAPTVNSGDAGPITFAASGTATAAGSVLDGIFIRGDATTAPTMRSDSTAEAPQTSTLATSRVFGARSNAPLGSGTIALGSTDSLTYVTGAAVEVLDAGGGGGSTSNSTDVATATDSAPVSLTVAQADAATAAERADLASARPYSARRRVFAGRFAVADAARGDGADVLVRELELGGAVAPSGSATSDSSSAAESVGVSLVLRSSTTDSSSTSDSADTGNGTTVPAGSVSGHWTLAGSPYRVTGDINVPKGSSLIIDPGVVVEFQGSYRFRAYGSLYAVGNASQWIVMTNTAADKALGSSWVGWKGLRRPGVDTVTWGSAPDPVDHGAGVFTLSYVQIEYVDKTGGPMAHPWEDDSGNLFFYGSFASDVAISNLRLWHGRTSLLRPSYGTADCGASDVYYDDIDFKDHTPAAADMFCPIDAAHMEYSTGHGTMHFIRGGITDSLVRPAVAEEVTVTVILHNFTLTNVAASQSDWFSLNFGGAVLRQSDAADAFAGADSSAAAASTSSAIADGAAAAEGGAIRLGVPQTDGASSADSSTVQTGALSAASDASSSVEAVAIGQGAAHADAGAAADASTVLQGIAAGDAAGAGESSTVGQVVASSDTAAAVDSGAASVTGAGSSANVETAAAADASSVALGVVQGDASSSADSTDASVTSAGASANTDGAAAVDVDQVQLGIAAADSSSSADSTTASVGGVTTSATSDSAATADSTSVARSSPAADTGAVTETALAWVSTAALDVGAVADSTVVTVVVRSSDSTSSTDAATVVAATPAAAYEVRGRVIRVGLKAVRIVRPRPRTLRAGVRCGMADAVVYQGDDADIFFVVEDVDGKPVNMTGGTVYCDAQPLAGGAHVSAAAFFIDDGPNGKCRARFTTAQTAGLTAGTEYRYDGRVKTAAGVRLTVGEGWFRVAAARTPTPA